MSQSFPIGRQAEVSGANLRHRAYRAEVKETDRQSKRNTCAAEWREVSFPFPHQVVFMF